MRSCSVSIGGNTVSAIGRGLLVLVGVAVDDGEPEARFLADKIRGLRIFPDESGKMNLSVRDVGGELMVVSQFTLLADCSKGRRPSFVGAAEPSRAEEVYEFFVDHLRNEGLEVRTGEFGALMTVSLENWGPVTLVIDRGPS